MSPDQSAALTLLTELADDRTGADRRFNLGIATARGTGLRVSEIAFAGRLSNSRVNAILEQQGKPFQPVANVGREYVLENAFTVCIVPAGRLALSDYEKYHAYICQPGRSFRDEMERLGFYASREISPHFPLIRDMWDNVPFSDEEAERRSASGDPAERELGSLIKRVLATPDRGGHDPGSHKVFLLTPRGHTDTLSLLQPIKHLKRGRGQAFVRKQRYTTVAALRRQPKTTAELLRFERS